MSASRTCFNPCAPKAPADTGAAVHDGDDVRISWTDRAGDEAGFRVDRKIAGGKWTAIAYRPPRIQGDANNPQEWIDFLAPPGRKLSYRVVALNEKDDDGAAGETVTIEVPK